MRSYTVQKTQGRPDWKNVPVLPIDVLKWTESTDVSAWAQLCWDEDALYIRMEAVEPHIRMEEDGVLADVCLDSCLEFFFRPTTRPDYINVEMNPNRAIWIGHGLDRWDLIRLLLPKVQKDLMDAQVEFTEKGWVLTYQIPIRFICRFFPEFEAKEGAVMHANFYKCGDKTVNPHYLCWNPIDLSTPDFHCPEYFGELILGGK